MSQDCPTGETQHLPHLSFISLDEIGGQKLGQLNLSTEHKNPPPLKRRSLVANGREGRSLLVKKQLGGFGGWGIGRCSRSGGIGQLCVCCDSFCVGCFGILVYRGARLLKVVDGSLGGFCGRRFCGGCRRSLKVHGFVRRIGLEAGEIWELIRRVLVLRSRICEPDRRARSFAPWSTDTVIPAPLYLTGGEAEQVAPHDHFAATALCCSCDVANAVAGFPCFLGHPDDFPPPAIHSPYAFRSKLSPGALGNHHHFKPQDYAELGDHLVKLGRNTRLEHHSSCDFWPSPDQRLTRRYVPGRGDTGTGNARTAEYGSVPMPKIALSPKQAGCRCGYDTQGSSQQVESSLKPVRDVAHESCTHEEDLAQQLERGSILEEVEPASKLRQTECTHNRRAETGSRRSSGGYSNSSDTLSERNWAESPRATQAMSPLIHYNDWLHGVSGSRDSESSDSRRGGDPYSEDSAECQPERAPQWEFEVLASAEYYNHGVSSTDVIGAIAFDKTDEYFATGGIARKIRVYAFESLVSKSRVFNGVGKSKADDEDDEDQEEDALEYFKQRRQRKRSFDRRPKGAAILSDHASSCVAEVCTPAKLSSVKWHLEKDNTIGCGDYDGVVAEWDIERNLAVSERDEHDGQRVWSIDYSSLESPSLCASASHDGSVRLWSRGLEQCVAVLESPHRTPVCCAEFGPGSSSLLALACADTNVYVHDIRRMSTPVLTLSDHQRAASNVRFISKDRLVSASTDSTVKLWDISSGEYCYSPTGKSHCARYRPSRTFSAHHNVRNFVGLSVSRDEGLIACGSEKNKVYAYDSSSTKPILCHDFTDGLTGVQFDIENIHRGLERPQGMDHSDHRIEDQSNIMVSAVCWRQKQFDCTLVAANSFGTLRVMRGYRI